VPRRALAHLAGGQWRRVGRHAARVLDLSLGVARARARAELGDDLVALSQRHQRALSFRRAPDEDQQQPRREGIERARVSRLRAPERAANGGDDVV
jgi:hypothetical protein